MDSESERSDWPWIKDNGAQRQLVRKPSAISCAGIADIESCIRIQQPPGFRLFDKHGYGVTLLD